MVDARFGDFVDAIKRRSHITERNDGMAAGFSAKLSLEQRKPITLERKPLIANCAGAFNAILPFRAWRFVLDLRQDAVCFGNVVGKTCPDQPSSFVLFPFSQF
jgi:hypothetical protein